MSAIVAGIIDTRTGEITETTDNTSAKTRLLLKVRDELNAEHGRDAFMVFEFNSVGGLGNLDFVKNKMAEGTGEALKTLYRLQALYRVQETGKELKRAEAELTTAEEARDECLALFGETQNAKRQFVESSLSESIEEYRDAVRELKRRLGLQRRRVAELTD